MPHQDGAGWLLRLCPQATAIMLALQVLLVMYCLYVIWRPKSRPLDGEEKMLVWFVGLMLVTPVSVLIGFAAWFAVDQVLVGVAAAVTFIIASVAFFSGGR